jgi:hypothetical protein
MKSNALKISAACLATVLLAQVAWSTSIPVNNPSFETPDASASPGYIQLAFATAGWTPPAANNNYVVNPSSGITIGNTTGSQILFTEPLGGDVLIQQLLTNTFAAGTYSLTVAVGFASGFMDYNDPANAELRLYSYDGSAYTQRGSLTITNLTTHNHVLSDYTFNLDVVGTESWINQPIAIGLYSEGFATTFSQNVSFDNVRLNYTAPSGVAIVVSSSANPSLPGSNVTFTATVKTNGVTAGDATGSVIFKNGATTLSTSTVSGGIATFGTTLLPLGTNLITAVYSGGGSYLASTGIIAQVVGLPITATIVTSSANPSVLSSNVTFTATVQTNGVTAASATGTVVFNNGTTPLSTNALSGGVATFSSSLLPQGWNTITAVYGGDGANSASTGSVAQVVYPYGVATIPIPVNNPSFETPDASASPGYLHVAFATAGWNPPAANNNYVMNPSSGITIGNTTGSQFLFTEPFSGNVLIYQLLTNKFTAGTYSLKVAVGFASGFQDPNQPATAELRLYSVQSGVYTVRGSLTITNLTTHNLTLSDYTFNLNVFGTESWINSPMAIGLYSDGSATASPQNVSFDNVRLDLTEGVWPQQSVTILTSSANPSVLSSNVTFTATVISNGVPAVGATGSVVFKVGATAVSTNPISGGVATYSTSQLLQGLSMITAVYGGDGGNFLASTNSLVQVVYPSGAIKIPVTINNPSFEDPVTGNYTKLIFATSGWTPPSDNNNYVLRNGGGTSSAIGVTGDQFLLTEPLSGNVLIQQLLTNNIAAGTYSLTVAVGFSSGFMDYNEPATAELRLYSYNGSAYTQRGSLMIGDLTTHTGTLSDYTLHLNVLGSESWLNSPIAVGLYSDGAATLIPQNVSFDNVRMDFTQSVWPGLTAPTITSVSGSGTLTLSTTSQIGYSYSLQSSPGLSPAAWTTISTLSGNGGVLSFPPVATTGLAKFFRISVQ